MRFSMSGNARGRTELLKEGEAARVNHEVGGPSQASHPHGRLKLNWSLAYSLVARAPQLPEFFNGQSFGLPAAWLCGRLLSCESPAQPAAESPHPASHS